MLLAQLQSAPLVQDLKNRERRCDLYPGHAVDQVLGRLHRAARLQDVVDEKHFRVGGEVVLLNFY